jgi:hypothetical protein
MAEGRSNQAIAARLYVNAKTVESHVHSVFTKLALLPEPDDHRRVLACWPISTTPPAGHDTSPGPCVAASWSLAFMRVDVRMVEGTRTLRWSAEEVETERIVQPLLVAGR